MTSSATPAAGEIAPIAVIAAHGDLAAGLVSAVEAITGRGALFVPLTNRDLGPPELEALIATWVDRGVRVVFTDLPAGSTTICARRLQRAHPELVVVTGASLAALLAFALAADKGAEEAARLAAEKARAALQVSGGTPAPAAGG
jgi:PTS system N-acetylgalactosamine-specific IIA component